jgi:HTH-type transcriptional regulator/antitoxin HigA
LEEGLLNMTEKNPSYTDLLLEFEPRPINSQSALARTYKLIDRLMSTPRLTRSQSEMLEMLSMLVEQYESREHPTPNVSAAEMLEHLIESRGISQATLAADTEVPRSVITDILAGRRRISIGNIQKFARYFNVSTDFFIKAQPFEEAESHKEG